MRNDVHSESTTGTRPVPDDVSAHDALARQAAPRLVTSLPGPRADRILSRDARFTSPSLPRAYPLVPERGAGAMVEDADGNVFLDLNAGIAVCSTGHCHPRVVQAIHEQAARLLHYSGSDFYLPLYGETCAALDAIAPMAGDTRSFLANSGTEAVEAAIKLARRNTGREHVIAFLGGFHGRSYGSMTLTASSASYHDGFTPLLPGVVHAPYGADDTDHYIENVIFKRLVKPSNVAAIVLEPVQGEGGYVVPPPGWLRYIRELCDEHGILFVADEVQSGMGRTGRVWAVEHSGVEPDLLLSGKGLASGMPLGAMTARADLMTWPRGAHGSTYGGNPLACAAALATIDLVRSGLAANAAEVGTYMLGELASLGSRTSIIREVRGVGLMIGVDFVTAAAADAVQLACFRRGALVLRAGDSAIRMSPPLVINRDQAQVGISIFEEACQEVGLADARGRSGSVESG